MNNGGKRYSENVRRVNFAGVPPAYKLKVLHVELLP